MACFVYILQCADNSFYTGWTVDLAARISAHNKGAGAKYTRGRTPVQLVYSETLPDKSTALRREIEIKKLTRSEKVQLMEQKTNAGFPFGVLH